MHLRQDVKLNGISPFFVIKYQNLGQLSDTETKVKKSWVTGNK